jgi:pyruvate/2-oxoglutarate dehydrogenase complex dihydrolipoamide acyltransferase (E2) component
MPQLGESMAEATIVTIHVKPGDHVKADQEIIEVETDKAVMGVTTPCAGEIAKIDAEVKGTYVVGAVLGFVEASEADAARFQKNAPEQPQGSVDKEVPGRQEEADEAAQSGNGSGSHFRIDESDALPTLAAASQVAGDRAGGLPCARERERRRLSLAAGAGTHGRAAAHAGRHRRRGRQRHRGSRHDQRSGEFPRRNRRANGREAERNPHRRG